MRPAPRRRAAAGLLAVLLAGGAGLAGCGGRGASLGTTSSPCFHALPSAAASVPANSHLIGVRLFDIRRLRSMPLHDVLPNTKEVCLVAFSGVFTPENVAHPVNDRSGPYVVVAVRPDGGVVYGSQVDRRLPLPFRHNHTL